MGNKRNRRKNNRGWTTAELLTAAKMNEWIRKNLAELKGKRPPPQQ